MKFKNILLTIITVIVITALFTGWWVKRNIYASEFKKPRLSNNEKKELEVKINQLDPEVYTEEGLKREIRFSEKELNAFLAQDDPSLSKTMSIDLSEDLISIKYILPMEDDIPVVGGKNILVRCGLELSQRDDGLFVALKGVTVAGIPLPDSWLGNIKNKNIINKDTGFWSNFSKGIEEIKIRDGYFYVKLKE